MSALFLARCPDESVVDILFNILYWVLIVTGSWLLWRKLSPTEWSKTGKFFIDEQKRRGYDYTLVDNKVHHKNAVFSGIEVLLPKHFPHIFLDSHANDKSQNAKLLINPNEKLSLEGNFDSYFQMFAPKQYQTLALSVITPDIMQRLIDAAGKYDVEIKGGVLRLITEANLRNRPERQAELVEVAGIITKEIDHKLLSWKEDSKNTDDVLEVVESGIVKIGRTYLPAAMFGVGAFLMLLALPFWIGGTYMAVYGTSSSGIILVISGFFFFPVCYFAIRAIVRQDN